MVIFGFAPLAFADCPDLDLALKRAEEDTRDAYLAEAQNGLAKVVEALGCGEPVRSSQHKRYFLTQAMIWSYQPDEARDEAQIELALQAAKLRDDTWEESWGSDTPEHKTWQTLKAQGADTLTLEIRGVGADESVWVDGIYVEPPAVVAPGMHLLQVGLPDAMRVARAIDVQESVPIQLPKVAGSEPEPTPKPEPEPEPEPRPPAVEGGPLRLHVASDRRVLLDATCAQGPRDPECRPVQDSWQLDAKAGMAPVWLDEGSRPTLFWVDTSPPRAGVVHVLPRPQHHEVFASGFQEPESWIVRTVLSASETCIDPIASSEDGPLTAPHSALTKTADLYLCAENAAGLTVAVQLDVPKRMPGATVSQVTQERLQVLDATVQDLPPPVESGMFCSESKPGCAPSTDAGEFGVRLDSRGGLHTRFSTLDGPETSVRYFFRDVAAPKDGKVSVVALGKALALAFQSFTDAETEVVAYQIVFGDEVPAVHCTEDPVTVTEPWVLLAAEGVPRHARVCAVDGADQISPGVVVSL